jgi:hypothetical protein
MGHMQRVRNVSMKHAMVVRSSSGMSTCGGLSNLEQMLRRKTGSAGVETLMHRLMGLGGGHSSSAFSTESGSAKPRHVRPTGIFCKAVLDHLHEFHDGT